ncbi:MAG TPA: NAD(P)H-binding protein [Propionicimonas sp.]|nr:NAD(P)H-binding protein [Propionicimonas sp.]
MTRVPLPRHGRVAVTGAAGAIGSRVVGLLAADGVRVTALVRDAARVHPSATAAVIDYADPPSLDAALAGADTLVFIGSDGRADRVLAHHRNVLAAARAAGVRRIVLLSSQDADAGSPFCYAPVYADTERELRDCCAEPVILRAGLYAEFFGRWVLDAARAGELAVPTRAAVAPISRADVALALATAAVTSAPSLSTITGSAAFFPEDLAALASRLGGRDVQARTTTVDEFRHRLIETGTDAWWSYAFASMFEAIDQDRFAAVTPDFTAITGRTPEAFEAVLRRDFAQ